MKKRIKEFFGDTLWKLRWISGCVSSLILIVLMNIGPIFLNHKIHQAVQHNKILHEIVMTTDGIAFTLGGGGPIGYQNYYKWHYVKWLKSPERTWFQKLMFWDVFPDAPPDEYQYPFLGKK